MAVNESKITVDGGNSYFTDLSENISVVPGDYEVKWVPAPGAENLDGWWMAQTTLKIKLDKAIDWDKYEDLDRSTMNHSNLGVGANDEEGLRIGTYALMYVGATNTDQDLDLANLYDLLHSEPGTVKEINFWGWDGPNTPDSYGWATEKGKTLFVTSSITLKEKK